MRRITGPHPQMQAVPWPEYSCTHPFLSGSDITGFKSDIPELRHFNA